MPVVYGDLYLGANLAADWAILFAASRLAGVRTPPWRLALAAVLGALYALGIALGVASFLDTPLARVGVSLLLLMAAFSPVGPQAFLRLALWLYAASSLAAGLAMAVSAAFLPDAMALASAAPWPAPWVALLVALLAVACLGLLAWRQVSRPFPQHPWSLPMEIGIGRERLFLRGLVDTGNLLTDPLTGHPVVVVEFRALADKLPRGWGALYRWTSGRRGGLALSPQVLGMLDAPGWEGWRPRFRLVPHRGVGGRQGILPGFRPDWMTLDEMGCRREAVTVAVCREPLSRGGEYQALIPACLLEREEERPVGVATERS